MPLINKPLRRLPKLPIRKDPTYPGKRILQAVVRSELPIDRLCMSQEEDATSRICMTYHADQIYPDTVSLRPGNDTLDWRTKHSNVKANE